MKKFTKTTLAIAAGLMFFQHAHADYLVSDPANVNIYGNNDSSNNVGEGVFITSNAGSGPINNDQSYIALRTSGSAVMASKGGSGNVVSAIIEVGGNRVFIDGGGAEITVDETVSINTNTGITGALGVTGATSIGGALSVQGLSTTTGINNTGTLNQIGATNVTGTTSINESGNANTTIGTLGGASVNTLQGAANNITAVGANTIFGATNTITAATNNSITATAGANAISAQTGNSITTATGNNAMTATLGSNNLTAAVSNNIQAPLNNIGTDRISTNNLGTGAFQSTNSIGNTVATTTVTSRAGNATQALANGSASTTVTTATAAASVLTGATTAPSSQVLLSNAGGTMADANGKILTGGTGYVSPTSPTAAVTLTNGLGNTHGLVVTESQTTLSGGTQSSSMTLSDRAATFSNAQTGTPITVTGVANGAADFDAVNVRQFAGAIAAVSAQANIPALAAGQDRTFGLGMGNFMGKTALAMGLSIRGNNNAIYKASLSSGLSAGGGKTVLGVGGAWGF